MGDLLARALQLGLESDAVFALQQAGFIQHVGELGPVSDVQPSAGSLPSGAKQNMQFRKRSLAAARMYLMDVMARTLGTAEHPIRTRLIEATDPGSVEPPFDNDGAQAFEAFLEMLRETATPSVVAHIEESFRDQLASNESFEINLNIGALHSRAVTSARARSGKCVLSIGQVLRRLMKNGCQLGVGHDPWQGERSYHC